MSGSCFTSPCYIFFPNLKVLCRFWPSNARVVARNAFHFVCFCIFLVFQAVRVLTAFIDDTRVCAASGVRFVWQRVWPVLARSAQSGGCVCHRFCDVGFYPNAGTCTACPMCMSLLCCVRAFHLLVCSYNFLGQ